MSHKKSGDCFAGSCEICNPPGQYITNDWKKKAEALQAQIKGLNSDIADIRNATDLPYYWCSEYWKMRDKYTNLKTKMAKEALGDK